jgi:hypothetical protein
MIKRRSSLSPIREWLTASLSVGLAVACSSSSGNGSGSGGDAGSTSEAGNVLSPVAEGGGTSPFNASCGQLATFGGGSAAPTCPHGQTCCTMFSTSSFSVSASCVAAGQCSDGGISNECQTGADCAGGQVCCAGAAASDAGAQDAAAEAGVAGGLGGFGGFNPASLSTSCQTTCDPGQTQRCKADADCPSGQTCQATTGFGGGAGFGGGGFGGGGAFGGIAGGDAGGFAAPMVCGIPLSDGGAAEAESDGTTMPSLAGDASTE